MAEGKFKFHMADGSVRQARIPDVTNIAQLRTHMLVNPVFGVVFVDNSQQPPIEPNGFSGLIVSANVTHAWDMVNTPA